MLNCPPLSQFCSVWKKQIQSYSFTELIVLNSTFKLPPYILFFANTVACSHCCCEINVFYIMPLIDTDSNVRNVF